MNEFIETDFDPSHTSQAYDLFKQSWLLNRDFAEMHEHILREGRYLDRFGDGTASGESPSQYAWRSQASFAMDCCGELIDLRVGNIFRTAPIRHYEDSPYAGFIDSFISDVDGAGTSMDQFMRAALVQYYINGVDIVVDKTRPANTSPTTLAQERQMGMKPYLTAMSPLQRLDWACDHAGQYKWVRYDLGSASSKDEHLTAGSRRYLTLTNEMWRLYDASSDSGSSKTSVLSGPMLLNSVPVVSFFYRQSTNNEYRKVPLSLLTRIAPVARALLNLISQGQLDIYMAIGILAASGVDVDQLPREIAPMCWLGFPEGTSVQHITPAVEHIAEKREWINMLTQAILRMGKVTGPIGEFSGRARSGVQVQIERTDLDNEMAATADQAEQVERDIIRLAISRDQGRVVPASEIGYHVEYNKKYVLAGVSELVGQAREFVDLGMGKDVPQLTKLFLKRVLDAAVRKDHPDYLDIRREIAAATFGTEV